MNRDLSKQRGFTLVELLVVIAIIGILIALLLPAVQAAREAARRMQCTNNMKQIGLALHNYHDSNKCFPPGSFHANAANASQRRGSILIRLLPFIEQQPLFKMFDFAKGTPLNTDNQRFPDGRLLAAAKIPAYICPTDTNGVTIGDPNANPPTDRWAANYAASCGPTPYGNNPNCPCPLGDIYEKTYAPVGHNQWNYHSRQNPAGPFTRNYSTWRRCIFSRMRDCKDGLTAVIFFGETRVDCNNHTRNGWSRSNNGQGLLGTLTPINYDSCAPNVASSPTGDGCGARCNWNMEFGFKSLHPNGVNIMMGDGSVRFFNESIDHYVYNELGDKCDGTAAQVPQ